MQTAFNEAEWLKLLFLLADTHSWLEDMSKNCLMQLPIAGKKQLLCKGYYMGIKAMAHIAERHYYKINRYPHTNKFHIPLTDILHYIKAAAIVPTEPLKNSVNFYRMLQTDEVIGFDMEGHPVQCITIITDASGNIITAFPGKIKTIHVSSKSIL